MRLYHFTARHHLNGGAGHPGPGILKVGLVANHHPLLRLPAHVWLTSDDRWDQSWSTRPVPLPDGSTCDRTEIRLGVEVPLLGADGVIARLPYRAVRDRVRADWLLDFEGEADLAGWFVYLGWLPPEAIVAIADRPLRVVA